MNHIQASRGFTLIELMVTISVMAILLAIAVPSFNEFRQRAALRGAADQIVTVWGDSRFEALRRNKFVNVGFRTDGARYCLGARTLANPPTGTIPTASKTCNCFAVVNPAVADNAADSVATACNIAVYPSVDAGPVSNQGEWRSILVATATTLGNDEGGVIIIDPKRGNITDPGLGATGDEGRIYLKTPDSTNANYRLNIIFDRNSRAVVCEPDDDADADPDPAINHLPQFTNRQCQPES